MKNSKNTKYPRMWTMLPALALVASAAVVHAAPAQEEHVQHAPHWGYQGEAGPQHWGELDTANSTCSIGHHQSPINLTSTKNARSQHALEFNYGAVQVGLLNNGHTIQADLLKPEQAPSITIDGKSYKLVQFHFHHPSEHTVAGKRFPMEMHLVHKDDAGNLAVLGVMIQQGAASKPLADLFSHLPQTTTPAGEHAGAPLEVSLAKVLPGKHAAWVYEGSLTTPPCSENVQWIVLKQPMPLSKEQIDGFKKLFPDNHRPVQSLNDRHVD